MNDLIFSLQATMPVFFVMVLGHLLGRKGFLTKDFCSLADRLVFQFALPCMLFLDMASIDLEKDFDLRFVGFCAIVTTVCILSLWLGAHMLFRDKACVGEFVQASYRSSAAILGTAFIINMYGDSGMAPLMIVGSVPLFNIFAVLILTLEPGNAGQATAKDMKKSMQKALHGILTNPIIIGIFAGVFFQFLPVGMPKIMQKTLSHVAQLATPLALLSIGATFEWAKAWKKLVPAVAAAAFKLVLLSAVFVPIALCLGFRDQKLIALLIMLSSPTTPTCYVMAKNMGHEGVLSSACIALTTLLSAFTLTFWIYLLKSMGAI